MVHGAGCLRRESERLDLPAVAWTRASCVAIACARKLRERNVIGAGERVVIVSTASALKFTEFKLGYHEKTLTGIDATYANTPVTLPPDVDVVARNLA